MKKTLIILRHAKAEAGQDDHERPLAARGVDEAERMGTYMATKNIVPQKILCSTSKRTRQTYDRIKTAHPKLPAATYDDKTYNASENQHLQNIASQLENISSLMIIAHNPGLHQLALRLSREGDHAALRHMAQEFPPASLVVIDLDDIFWRDIKSARGELVTFVTPKTV
jgi:phosphohistidine phosphatase